MPNYSPARIQQYFDDSDSAPNNAAGRTQKGRALEILICYLFEKVPGILITQRNQQNAFQTEEIEFAFWNDKLLAGFDFLPNIILVECKNWSEPVDTEAVTYFLAKIQNRGLDFGVLIATNRITGDPNHLTRANFAISAALAHGRRLIIITRTEIETLTTTEEFLKLFKKKLCNLALTGAAG